ncbi:hypothetical protein [Tunturiibacter gelidoferens]|jgi:hypothetical protein|uniref:TrbI/VirB10 family protein n=1 Tax=Tunturiibacter gelidiferens TaxID=3069689 RepID=A0A9X0U5Q4_9BACT|nr:hypothetical protein [Edaphobacter lichenicola]MBB5330786.1 hypothetical protein [Edaphobacter lichenicola]
MKMHITTAALVLAAAPAFSQNAMTGVSNPDPVAITSSDDTATQGVTAKPSAALPATAPTSPAVEYGPYVPYKGATVAATSMMPAEPAADDPDAMIVTSVPELQGTLREGTLLKVKIGETLTTDKTVAGSRFSATVSEAIERNGRVIIPVGSTLEGRVTEVRGGRRISGVALLHLETSDVTLPDGTHYIVHAQLIDTGKSEFNVDREGTLKRKDHVKETLAIVGGVTGAGAATGALIGGGVGAVVGAGIGAGVSTVIWLKQDRQATLPKDELLVFSLTTPMILTPLSGTPVSSLNTSALGGVGAAQ